MEAPATGLGEKSTFMYQSDKIPVTQLLEVWFETKGAHGSWVFRTVFPQVLLFGRSFGPFGKDFGLPNTKGFRLVIVEIDSPEAFKLLGEADQTNPNFDIICGLLKLVGDGCDYKIFYLQRRPTYE